MRVCFLTHYFPPEVGAPQTRIALLARGLAAAGCEVTVHTGFPHYPDGVIPEPYRNRPWSRESVDGVRLLRSLVLPAPNRHFARRVVDHASLATSALATLRLSGPLDVVVAETPPLFTAAAGVVYARRKHAACIVNVADLWPSSAIEMGALRSPAAIDLAERLERWVYRHADLVTAPTRGITDSLAARAETAGRVRRTWPVVDVDRFDPAPPPALGGPLRVLYAGTVGLAQGLEVLVDAAELVGPEVVAVTIAGAGAKLKELRARVAARDGGNVTLLGRVGPEQIPQLYTEADVGAVVLRDLPIFRGALPTKLFEVMAAARPVLLAGRGESADLISDTGAGLVVEPEDSAALAEAIRLLQADSNARLRAGQAGRAWVERYLGADRATAAWMEILGEVTQTRSGEREFEPAAAARYRVD